MHSNASTSTFVYRYMSQPFGTSRLSASPPFPSPTWNLSAEYPEMGSREMFCRELWAQNHRDMYLGFTPFQHAFGKTPQEGRNINEHELLELPILAEAGVFAEHGHHIEAMRVASTACLEQQAKERIRRAEQAGYRKMNISAMNCNRNGVYTWEYRAPVPFGHVCLLRARRRSHSRNGRVCWPKHRQANFANTRKKANAKAAKCPSLSIEEFSYRSHLGDLPSTRRSTWPHVLGELSHGFN